MADIPANKSPIINTPYEEPRFHWHIPEHEEAEKVAGRRLPLYRYTRPGQDEKKHGYTLELKIVSRIRREMKEWLPLARQGEGGVSAITAVFSGGSGIFPADVGMG